MRNPTKAAVKTALLAKFDPDTVRKGMARAECWMRAAYGSVDYSEDDVEAHVQRCEAYCIEAAADGGKGSTMNRETFGRNRS